MSNLKIDSKSKIFVAGSSGMVGSAVVRKLQAEKYTNIVTSRSKNLDCRNQNDVDAFFAKHKFDVVVIAAAKVGGILANNDYRGDFIYDNLQIQINLIHSAKVHNVKINFSWFVLHLSKTSTTTYKRRISAHFRT